MRPLRLYMEGFTAYTEPVEIDFRPLNFFAIQGSTGAGKTSIVDAITFALYGKVSRYGNAQALKKVVSRGKRTMRVYFEFSVRGKEYAVERFYKRGAKGREESIVRVYEEGIKQNVKGREVESWVEKATGIDFRTFTKVIVLPQGEFDKFLKPDRPKERKDILIRLINLEVLERIREMASEEYKALGRELELIKARLQELEGFDEETLASIESSILSLESSLAKKRERRERLEAQLTRAKKKKELNNELRALSDRLEALKAKEGEMQALEERLEEAKRILPFVNLIEELDVLEEDIRKDREKLARYQGELGQLREELSVCLEEFKKVEESYRNLGTLEEELTELIKEEEKLKRLHEEAKRLGEVLVRRERLERELKKLKEELEDTERRIEKGEELTQEERRRWEELEFDEEEYRELLEKSHKLETLKSLEEELETLNRRLEENRRELAKFEKELSNLLEQKEGLERSLREKELLYHAHVIHKNLTPGDRCPVCGGTYRGASQEGADLEQVRELNDELSRLEAKIEKLNSQLLRQQAQAESWESEKEKLKGKLAELEELKEENVYERLGQLRELSKKRKELESKLRSYESRLEELKNYRRELLIKIERVSTTLESLADEEDRLKESLEGVKEGELSRRLSEVKKKIASLRKSMESIKRDYERKRGYIEELRREKSKREEGLGLVEKALIAKEERKKHLLGKLSPIYEIASSLEEIRAKAVSQEELKALESELQSYREELTRLKHRIEEIERELESLDDIPEPESLEREYEELVRRIDRLSQELGSKKAQRESVREKLREKESLEKKVPELESKLRVYGRLKEDMRSDRFQSFVANMLMKEILEHANYYFEKFVGDYSFEIDERDNLLVVDRAKGGLERSVESLSGGETFLASLSLALGVSDVLSSDAHLESLFIDEGFGSLDQETRDRVGDVLEVLKTEINKMVGVITHIPEFAERFSQRILVKKEEGVSRIQVIA